jgi:hypothetical protein
MGLWNIRLNKACEDVAREKAMFYIHSEKKPVRTREFFKHVLDIANALLELQGDRARMEIGDFSASRTSKKSKDLDSSAASSESSQGSSAMSRSPTRESSGDFRSPLRRSPWSPSLEEEEEEGEEGELSAELP